MLRGKSNRLGSPSLADPIDIRTAGVGEAQQLPDFVEGFPGGIVLGPPEQPVMCERLDLHEHGMSAADDQRDGREHAFRAPKNGESRCPSIWFTARYGLRWLTASALAADVPIISELARPGPQVAANASISSIRKSGSREGPADDGLERAEMVPRRHFRHHPAIFLMNGDLRSHFAGEQLRAAQNGGGGFVARRLDRQDRARRNQARPLSSRRRALTPRSSPRRSSRL